MASLMLSIPVANCTSRSNPRPKPAWGTAAEKRTSLSWHVTGTKVSTVHGNYLKNRENHNIQLYPPVLASMVKVFNLIHIAVDPNTTSSSPCSDFAHPTGLRGDQGALPSGFLQ